MCTIEELRDKAINGSITEVLPLLRNAMYFADALEMSEYSEWIEHELYGYSNKDTVPVYRIFHGDIVQILEDEEILYIAKDERLPLQIQYYLETVTTIYELCCDKRNGYVNIELNPLLNKYLREYWGEGVYRLHVQASQLVESLHQIQNIIVQWTSFLIEYNLSGIITEEEIEKARNIPELNSYYYITTGEITNFLIGDANMDNTNIINGSATGVQIQQGSVGSSQAQKVNSHVDFEAINEILEQILKYQSMFESEFGEKSKEILEAINEAKSAIENKDKSKLKSAWNWLKSVAASASGGVIAAGIKSIIEKATI